MKENEFKGVVRKDELSFIESYLLTSDKIKDRFEVQTNYYYDTENFDLDKTGMTCRVREKNGKLSGTFKIHGKNSPGENLEINLNIKELSETINIQSHVLSLMGSLRTERKILTLEEGLSVMLDLNTYLGEEDAEIEIEFTPEKKDKACALLKEIDEQLLQYCMMCGYDMSDIMKPFSPSKSERFMKKKRKMKETKNDIIISLVN